MMRMVKLTPRLKEGQSLVEVLMRLRRKKSVFRQLYVSKTFPRGLHVMYWLSRHIVALFKRLRNTTRPMKIMLGELSWTPTQPPVLRVQTQLYWISPARSSQSCPSATRLTPPSNKYRSPQWRPPTIALLRAKCTF